MILLIAVSLVWAFSFGLIKGRLTGLDPEAVSVVRLGLAALVFLPVLRLRAVTGRQAVSLAAIGAVQFGLMYVAYLRAFTTLAAHEVALFTIFTPLYVALIDACLERRWVGRHALAALLAVAGAAVILADGRVDGAFSGFFWVQLSNVCFALGQVAYKRVRRGQTTPDAAVFVWLYLGAVAFTAVVSAGTTDWTAFQPTPAQWATLVYLGVLASGAAFFAWNVGARQVNTGTLAVMNNLKIPLAVAVSLVVFGEAANLPRLAVSLVLITAAVLIAQRDRSRHVAGEKPLKAAKIR